AGAPELRRCAGVEGVLEHPPKAAVLDLPGDLAAELEVEPDVVDRPRLVRVDEDAALRPGDELRERRRARLEVDVRHADDGDPRGALRAHGAVRPAADRRRGVAARQVADEDAALDEMEALRGHAVVVESEGA